MQYKFTNKTNFEDLSSGRVLHGKSGYTNFSVRLTCEIFMYCVDALDAADKAVTIYDPCCGSGYLLTVLGFIYNERIKTLYGSDISDEAIELARSNLGLLTSDGLNLRISQLEGMYCAYGKDSHLDAIKSAERLEGLIKNPISYETFKRDILNPADNTAALSNGRRKADIVIADVPYGDLVSWSNGDGSEINTMLNNIFHDICDSAVVAIVSDKSQKINPDKYKRVKKLQIGKRKIEILRKL